MSWRMTSLLGEKVVSLVTKLEFCRARLWPVMTHQRLRNGNVRSFSHRNETMDWWGAF
jgi:hypothetical protein